MSFKKLKGVNRTYREQGQIYFTCLNYDRQPKAVQEKIRRLCRECGGEHEQALFAMLTRDVSPVWVADQYHVDPSTLYRRRKRFYERW